MADTPKANAINAPNAVCRKCGRPLAAMQVFCFHCGAKANSAPTPPIASLAIDTQWRPKPTSKPPKSLRWWIETIAIGSGAIVFALFLASRGSGGFASRSDAVSHSIDAVLAAFKTPPLDSVTRSPGALFSSVYRSEESDEAEPPYVVIKRDSGVVSVKVPFGTATMSAAEIMRMKRVIQARERAKTVRIFNLRGQPITAATSAAGSARESLSR